uniref:Suppressor of cytokine signaling at 16D, isoform B n=2 Tax=Drosophila melanogaster TaxID=7227 RepID=M9PHY7_DROME|nr:suppressor of cytokine signaling at 16D, isoform B [Drosophila melanogaster]AGB95504.1 suppressor of cytokine signaling at 16D, isoform B [Drosophila melanogaster]|eukprot:NP_001259662.1 suppressor of cytokine signaling at 16D, isoform B [Drosophila melanogaster]
MDSSIKLKDSNSNCSSNSNGNVGGGGVAGGGGSGSGGVCVSSICSSDSFSIMPPPHHELVSANSIELNAAASLSDDSGVPLTTNSSISSGDSYRLGMCKFEIEMVESDGEVSQFDSLDNCSEGGMSAENFNTLKKGPLAPIDPPPEFQDSPQTTLVRSISKNIVNSLRRWTSSQSSFEHLKDDATTMVSGLATAVLPEEPHPPSQELVLLLAKTECKLDALDGQALGQMSLKESYAINKHLYSSDSILNSHTDNIYDEPNNIVSSSLGNSVDLLDEEQSDASSCSPLPSPPPPVSIVKIKQTLCPYYQDHTRYFKAIPTEQDNIASAKAAAAQQRFNSAGLSEIHDYDLYYGARRQPVDNSSLQRRQASLYSPLGHTSHCHYHHSHGHGHGSHHHHHHHQPGYGYSHGQRPNSRNSLNSRLSSSHNSLNVSSANKPDDSIFITQAMSHDALFTREISDFYNVPIDSDIYAFPVDMIEQQQQQQLLVEEQQQQKPAAPTYHKASRRNKRNKRKQRYAGSGTGAGTETSDGDGEKSKHGKYRTPVGVGMGQVSESEPLHMTLDEVKQFYHTLYSDAGKPTPKPMVKSSNETIWSVSTNTTTTTARTRSSVGTTRGGGGPPGAGNGAGGASSDGGVGGGSAGGGGGKYLSKQNKHNLDNDKLNNNNNNNNNHQPSQQQLEKPPTEHHNQHQPPNNKHVLHSEKKSQFTLNLKQRFCSIFRFRRSNHSRCRGSGNNQTGTFASANANAAATAPLIPPIAVITSAPGAAGQTQLASELNGTLITAEADEPNADLRKKFQSRALPPLPKKALPFTAAAYAIEAVKSEPEEVKTNAIQEPRALQFTSSIEKVKDYGWYWGPLSSEAAEKVLSSEPDGSFIVRDSSDDHYIFSLSFKLNNCVRHVRIEQDQGTFSFGSYAKFKSQTITEFIEKAVEHSRSGRYLFFLHRRPEHGPMRVQLTNPVSRFKHVQSLQHMCRFVILKAVIRKDLIQTLPLPRRLLDYLNYKHCYSEQVESDSSHSQISGDGTM